MTKKVISSRIFFTFSLLSMLGSLFYVFWLRPEATQGVVQKIFFFHVPAAFAMYLALGAGALLSTLWLYEKKTHYDQLAQACLYTATLFATAVLVSGPLWAKPIWGVYWTWDPRLTTTFVVFILLMGYCLVRMLMKDNPQKGALVGAFLSILAFLDVPLIHWSVKLWRGIHPTVIKNPQGLPESYQMGLEFMIVSVFCLMAFFLMIFYRIIKLTDKINRLLEVYSRSREVDRG